MPFVSAQFYYNYLNPSDLLDNPWFIFTVFFAVFFGVIYISLGRVLGGTTPTLIISAAIAFAVSAGVQRNWYILEQPVMFWAVILIAGLIIATFAKLLMGGEGVNAIVIGGVIATIWGLWPFLKDFLPLNVIGNMPYELVDFLDNTWPYALIVAVTGLILWGRRKKARIIAAGRPESHKFS